MRGAGERSKPRFGTPEPCGVSHGHGMATASSAASEDEQKPLASRQQLKRLWCKSGVKTVPSGWGLGLLRPQVSPSRMSWAS